LKQFPEPPAKFLVGHGLEISSTTNLLHTFTKFTTEYGSTVKIRLGSFYISLITIDYKLIELILSSNKNLMKSLNYSYVRPWLGNGLLLSDGAYWKQHRKILTPAFHFEILKQFVGIFQSVGNVLIDNLRKYEESPSVDLHPLVALCTLDTICETAMGTKINAQKGDNNEYVHCVKEMCRIVIDRCLSPIKLFRITYWMTKDYYIQKKVLHILHEFTTSVITSKKQTKNGRSDDKKSAFLDLLLKFSQDQNLLSDEEIREEVDTFMFEGHDTTASAICFALYALANHPKIQKTVLEEQRELFGDEKDPTIAYQELQDMKYLELVIKETLRLYPSVPVIGRYTQEDFLFEGQVIPKRTNVALYIYGLHRNPEYFPEPEKFDPDRFDNLNGSLPFAYIPFSAGPRNCIGQKFAMLEMKSVISKVIRHFELTPAVPRHELILSVETVLRSANGIKVGLKKRI
jgi:cytochrome P450 family 4